MAITIIGAGNTEVKVEKVDVYYIGKDGNKYGKVEIDGVEYGRITIEVMQYPESPVGRWLVAE